MEYDFRKQIEPGGDGRHSVMDGCQGRHSGSAGGNCPILGACQGGSVVSLPGGFFREGKDTTNQEGI